METMLGPEWSSALTIKLQGHRGGGGEDLIFVHINIRSNYVTIHTKYMLLSQVHKYVHIYNVR